VQCRFVSSSDPTSRKRGDDELERMGSRRGRAAAEVTMGWSDESKRAEEREERARRQGQQGERGHAAEDGKEMNGGGERKDSSTERRGWERGKREPTPDGQLSKGPSIEEQAPLNLPSTPPPHHPPRAPSKEPHRLDSPISILTICFHAVNLSMRMSDGLSSCGAVFFLICWAGGRACAGESTSERETGSRKRNRRDEKR
jgi:hypothetical protein